MGKRRALFGVIAFFLAITSAWTLIELVGSGMAFNRTEFDGLKTGMSRAQALVELKKSGITELVALSSDEPVSVKGAVVHEGEWIRLGDKNSDLKIYQHDAWSYGAPNSYSTVDIEFKGDDLISIKYRWRPFEG